MKEIGYEHGGLDDKPETLFDGKTFDPKGDLEAYAAELRRSRASKAEEHATPRRCCTSSESHASRCRLAPLREADDPDAEPAMNWFHRLKLDSCLCRSSASALRLIRCAVAATTVTRTKDDWGDPVTITKRVGLSATCRRRRRRGRRAASTSRSRSQSAANSIRGSCVSPGSRSCSWRRATRSRSSSARRSASSSGSRRRSRRCSIPSSRCCVRVAARLAAARNGALPQRAGSTARRRQPIPPRTRRRSSPSRSARCGRRC